MTASRVVAVVGGGPSDRAAVTAGLLLDAGGTALVMTGHPGAVDARLDTSADGPVEVRVDDPAARLEAYRSGAVDPDDDVLAALAAGVDTPLAAVLAWEYARRAAAADWWDVVVVELDGDLPAVRGIAAAGELGAFVESRWPAHVRFASMAAGERADARVRDAHRLALLAAGVEDFLAGTVEVVVAGGVSDAVSARTAGIAELARGAVTPALEPDDEGGYRLGYPAPGPPDSPVTVEGGRLCADHGGVRARLRLPPVLGRCELVDWDFDPRTGRMVVRFVPDPALWPPDLVPSGPVGRAG